ncbi:hypothetical protein [Eubacterium coprostanoligenes]|uniref:Por secretion system C-terminal sorting domain-containing protein n=1 Tax=Eubacterium coprostanoligenes TaxID=290054 RepID=A0A1T4NES9_9FIRM|nr:hypothetical protein [Eubacterium coprostanoligenes]SJZ77288.1 Por secretion system C-terminal sorting domain-containing protein [Eubacterium coprostanoligenes]
MKLAKKTLSVALAAVMAASSLAGTVSAFAADALQNSPVKYEKIVNGQATVKANVTIDTTKAAKTADVKTDEDKKNNKSAQIDETTLSSYYSFTPARTGVYTMKVESAPVYYGYSRAEYAKWADKKGMTEAEKKEKAHVYSSKKDELFTDVDWKTKVTDVQDSVVIDNVASTDKVDTVPDAFIPVTDAGTPIDSTAKKETKAILSYKYVNYNDSMKGIVVDKEVKDVENGKEIKLGTLTAGKTYYFKATLNEELLVTTKNEKDSKDVEYTYVKKADAYNLASAKITVSQKTGMKYDTTYTDAKDKQKIVVPSDYTVAADEKLEYDSKTNKYYVEKTVKEGATTATYYGYATAATVADTANGAKVTAFTNEFAGLQTITLGANVKTIGTVNIDGTDVPSLSTKAAPQLKSVVVKNPEFVNFAGLGVDADKVTFTVPANTAAWYAAVSAGYKVNVTCAHKWVVTKAATIFATGTKKCSECDATATVAKVRFAPTAKASKKKIVVKGNAGKVAKLAVWVYNSNGKLVKKQVKKNVTKNTVKVAKAGKYTVKVKAYGPNGAKTASVKKTVKVK